MGNVLSEEQQQQAQQQDDNDDDTFFKQGLNLESPDADKEINYGAAAPRCQPKHTETAQQQQQQQQNDNNNNNNNNKSDNDKESNKEQQQQQQKLSYIQMARMGYQELVNAIIRPPRADYKMEALGPPAFNFCGKRFTRTDFGLRTKRGYNLECSHWEPVQRATDRIPVVIYMHGNSSARVEVLPQLSYLLSLGLAVFCFDFAGSGKSDGDYVSLGYYEREDLSCVVAHLRATNVVSTIALWGRSMGAATALMFGDRDPSIACMILDSSFSDLTQLCEEMCEKGREQGIVVPGFVVSVALSMIQRSVKKQAGFNIKQISPIAHADKCFIPALFVAGEHDDFIKKHHSEALHAKYAGDKNIIIVEGDHNSPRPKFMFDSASIFLQTCLQIPAEWTLQVPVSMNLMCPPWYFEIYQQRAARRRQHQLQRGNSSSTSSSSRLPVTAFNPEEVGMTTERQRAIQASLFKMLGQADEEEKKTASSTSSSSFSTTSTAFASSSTTAAAAPPLPTAPPKQQQEQQQQQTNSSTERIEVGVPVNVDKNRNNSQPTAGSATSEPVVEMGIPMSGPPLSLAERSSTNTNQETTSDSEPVLVDLLS